MKKSLLLSVCVALMTAVRVFAQDLTAAELERATTHLEQTRAALIAATDGLSDAQWQFKPGPTRWSVAEVTEHLASAEAFLMGVVQDVMKAPPRSEPANLEELDALVLQAIADRTNRVQAPEPLAPSNRFGDPARSLEQFKANRAKTLAFLKETKDLRGHAGDSPLGQKLDAYQWLLFISAHCERHTKQIHEVKADPAFPKS